MHAQQIRCPSCLAPVATGSAVSPCRYCGATLALQAPVLTATAARQRRADVTAPVVLEDAGDNKIEVIRIIRQHTGIGLREAKDMTDSTPCVVANWPGESTRMVMLFFDLAGAGARVR